VLKLFFSLTRKTRDKGRTYGYVGADFAPRLNALDIFFTIRAKSVT
jgi:hypothetical protein